MGRKSHSRGTADPIVLVEFRTSRGIFSETERTCLRRTRRNLVFVLVSCVQAVNSLIIYQKIIHGANNSRTSLHNTSATSMVAVQRGYGTIEAR